MSEKTNTEQAIRAEARMGAFEFDGTGSIEQCERVILSIAFLMEWNCEIGNEDLNGYVAFGLSRLLRSAAKDMKMHHSRELKDAAQKAEADQREKAFAQRA